MSKADGTFSSGLSISESGEIVMASSLLQNPMRNRFIGVVKEVLTRPFMPQQTYVLGVPSSSAPFIWQTFYNGPDADQHPTKVSLSLSLSLSLCF